MKITAGYPPNIEEIKRHLTPPKTAVFAYGDTIYNPTGQEIDPDLIAHEEVHERQMGGWLPDAWWQKYLLDKDFRKQMEVEAYAEQLKWWKSRANYQTQRNALEEMAVALSEHYGLGINYHEAETLIRKYG